ncbi:MAG: yugH3 [Bacilli bacterium]|nr:yugH3 [Bacilli bacterium]
MSISVNSIASRLSPIVNDLPPSGIRRFFELANSLEGVISLGVGEPDFRTPWHVREACVYSLEKGYTGYSANAGHPELCAAISNYLERRFDVSYHPGSEILVTVGASEAIDLALRTLLLPGEEVLIPEPAYVSYRPCTLLAGGKPVGVPTSADDEFRMRAADLEAAITPLSKAVILCYPSNPTGSTLSRADLEQLAEVIIRHDLFVIADEIYAELTYQGEHVSIASLPGMKERTILVSGMSKAFAMTGWRIGYACTNAEILHGMYKIHQYSIMCAPITGQMAAIEALTRGETEKDRMVHSYDQRRRFIVNAFRDLGLDCHEPKGAFYAFPSIKSTGLSSEQFAELALIHAKVAMVPGSVFGDSGEGFLRASYATSIDSLQEAIERLDGFLSRLRRGDIDL